MGFMVFPLAAACQFSSHCYIPVAIGLDDIRQPWLAARHHGK
ncbi:Uncharacterized protein PPKH_2677 [Pseudomonas putida]|nr:Uncharacterized protein PPKH_2677 [Pseudomonas putida]